MNILRMLYTKVRSFTLISFVLVLQRLVDSREGRRGQILSKTLNFLTLSHGGGNLLNSKKLKTRIVKICDL